MLASTGMEVKRQIDQYIFETLSGDFDLKEINVFIQETLNITYKKSSKKMATDI
ncbi:hypothetical protein [Ruoffia tabacinasalis]|uniref:hypothetical protein n=1 Tax=Ruoffia tabacinasalis TaxID=87458 RepID=UPI0030CF5437